MVFFYPYSNQRISHLSYLYSKSTERNRTREDDAKHFPSLCRCLCMPEGSREDTGTAPSDSIRLLSTGPMLLPHSAGHKEAQCTFQEWQMMMRDNICRQSIRINTNSLSW